MHIGIHLFAQLLAGGLQRGVFLFNGGLVVSRECSFQVFDGGFNFFLLARIQFVAVFGQALLDAVDVGFTLVAGLHQLQLFLVVRRVELGIFDHLLNFSLGQTRIGLDGDFVLFAGAFVFCAHVQNAVGVNVKRHLNLWRAT